MIRFVYILLFVFVFVSCDKSDVAKGSPKCISNKLQEFKKTCCEQGASVKEYTFQGEKVYVFDPGNCGADMAATVTDEDCNTIGMLGGFAGSVQVNGEDFSNASFEQTIWEE